MPIDDNWKFGPTRVYMHPDTFRDLVAWQLVEQGWSEEEALSEADRRLATILPPPSEPDPLILEIMKQMDLGEG
jgi:hypothetical protein